MAQKKLAVVAENTHYTLYINGAYVAEFDDDRLSNGYGGVFISMDEGDTSVVEFDNFTVNAP